jgi:hypothetical protein
MVMSSEVETSSGIAVSGAAGFLDAARSDNRKMAPNLARCAKFYRWRK